MAEWEIFLGLFSFSSPFVQPFVVRLTHSEIIMCSCFFPEISPSISTFHCVLLSRMYVYACMCLFLYSVHMTQTNWNIESKQRVNEIKGRDTDRCIRFVCIHTQMYTLSYSCSLWFRFAHNLCIIFVFFYEWRTMYNAYNAYNVF